MKFSFDSANMRFILLAFGVISFVNGKSVLLQEEEEVEHVNIQPLIFKTNQKNLDFYNKAKVSLQHGNSYHPTLVNGIRPVEEKDFKKTKIVIGTTHPENNLNVHSQSGEANVNPYENSFIPSYENDNKSKQNLKDSNVATDITATKNNQVYKTPNEVVLQTFDGTYPKLLSYPLGGELKVKKYKSPVISLSGHDISTEPELKAADVDINKSSSQSNTGEEVINLKIPSDEVGIATDVEPNINVDIAKFQNNPYFFSRLLKGGLGLEKPKFKITAKINTQNNENYLPRIFLDGNTNLQSLGDKYNDGFEYKNENDLMYTNEWENFPDKKTFNGRDYVNIINKDNIDKKLKTENVIISQIDPQNNAYLYPNPSGVVHAHNFYDNEGEFNQMRGNDLFYVRDGRIFPSIGSYNGRQYVNYVNRRKNPTTSSSELINSTKQILNANDEDLSKADSKTAAYLWQYLFNRDKNLKRNLNNNRRLNDKESALFYTSNGRTFPLTRSMEHRNFDRINNEEYYNPYYASKWSIQPNELWFSK